MGKLTHDDVLDGSLNVIKNNCTRMVVCSQAVTTFTEANVTYALADVTMESADFTIADDTSGRKLTVAAKSGVTVDASDSDESIHLALLDVDDSKLLYVTTGTSAGVITSGNTCNIPAWKISIPDPS